jgi:hypothetical protein
LTTADRCTWRDCARAATRRLGFGHHKASYCDRHAADVRKLFFVDSDVALKAAAQT